MSGQSHERLAKNASRTNCCVLRQLRDPTSVAGQSHDHTSIAAKTGLSPRQERPDLVELQLARHETRRPGAVEAVAQRNPLPNGIWAGLGWSHEVRA